MKKIYVCFFLLMGMFLSSCQKDTGQEPDPVNPTFSVEEAEAFFEDQKPFLQIPRAGTRSSGNQGIQPLWEEGRAFETDGRLLVEVPMDYAVFSRIRGSEDEVPEKAEKSNTVMKLLAEKLDEGLMEYRIMEIQPYGLAGEGVDPAAISLPLADDFSGEVLYRDLQGNLLFGYILKDGNKIATISSDPGMPETSLTRSGEMSCEYRFTWTQASWYVIVTYPDGRIKEINYENEDYYSSEWVCWIGDNDPGHADPNNPPIVDAPGGDPYIPPIESNVLTDWSILNDRIQSMLSRLHEDEYFRLIIEDILVRMKSSGHREHAFKVYPATFSNRKVFELKVPSYSNSTIDSYDLLFDFEKALLLSDFALEYLLFHELAHCFFYDGTRYNSSIDYRLMHHYRMIYREDFDVDYALRTIFPGKTEQWYNEIVFYGCTDTEDFKQAGTYGQMMLRNFWTSLGLP